MRAIAVAVVLVLASRANAQEQASDPQPQTIACDECVRGQQELDAMQWQGRALKDNAKTIVDAFVPLRIEGTTLDERQAQGIRTFRQTAPSEMQNGIDALADKTDEQLRLIAFALCNSPDAECARLVAAGLHHARQVEQLPPISDLPSFGHRPEQGCDPYVVKVRSPKGGLGFDYATGWQQSARPTDGRAWSLGLEARARLTKAVGLVARIDRSTGRDEARDGDGDGRDDAPTGRVLRWTMMAGPSLIVHVTRDRDMGRYWQVDSLVGTSRSGDQSGLVLGYDVSYQLVVARVGFRMLVGFGDAGEERSALVHTGFQFGAGPQFAYGAGCGHGNERDGSKWGLAIDVPISGWSTQLGYITPGFGVEAVHHFHSHFDGLVRADLLAMPSGDRERSLHQSILVGGRIDMASGGGVHTGFFTTLAVGYDFVSGPSSSPVRSGPIADVSLGWGAQASDGAAYLRLHGRMGIEYYEWRAIFLSAGMELRFDRSQWRKRS